MIFQQDSSVLVLGKAQISWNEKYTPEIYKSLTSLERYFLPISIQTLFDIKRRKSHNLDWFCIFVLRTSMSNLFNIFNLQKYRCLKEKYMFSPEWILMNESSVKITRPADTTLALYSGFKEAEYFLFKFIT